MQSKIQQQLSFDIQQSMTLSISIATLVVLLLTHAAEPACLNPTQLDGLCQACPPSQILNYGFCFASIPGCLTQLSPNVCGSCAGGWVLLGNSCLQNTYSTAPSNALSSLETYADNAPDLKYQLLDFYFKKKYSGQLVDKISNVSMAYHLKTTYGDIYALTYSNPFSNAATIYRAEGIVDPHHNVTEYRFQAIPLARLNDYSGLLWFIDRRVIVNNLTLLQTASLNQVQQLSQNNYRFFYITFQGQIYVKDVERNNSTPNASLSFPDLTQLYYQINQNTVINYVFSLFPRLQKYATYAVNFYTITDARGTSNDYYKFLFDSQIIVIVEVKGLNLILFNYQEPDNVVNITNGTPAPGGYLPFLNLNDQTYLKTRQFVLQQYPFLTNKNIESVRYQVVAGTNFMIQFNNDPFSADSYLVVVNVPLGSATPIVSHLYKSGIDIRNNLLPVGVPGAFNYEADPIFKGAYGSFRPLVEARMKNVLPIASVQYVVNANSSVDYMVVYTASQYAFLRYTPTTPVSYQVLNYKVFGIEVPLTVSTRSAATRNEIISFLQQQKPSLFGKIILIQLIADLNANSNTYEVDILTQYGTYYTRVYQQGLLYLSTITQTSQGACSDLSPAQHTQNLVVANLSSFITQNYKQVKDFSLTLVQGYVSRTSGVVSFRFVFAKQNIRYEVQISQSLGHYLINKLTQFDGSGCETTSVKVAGICQNSCSAFSF